MDNLSAGEKMNIAIIGYGKMGHEIELLAKASGIGVASIIDKSGIGAYRKIDEVSLKGADVALDFSSPEAVIGNVSAVSAQGKNMVVGTTGWYERKAEALEIVGKSGTGLIYSPNFSIGMNLFLEIVGNAASVFDAVQDYDSFVHEWHHRQKLDSPSGTAKRLAERIIANMKRKKRIASNAAKIAPEELHVSSTRAGSMPGMHLVGFDSEEDTIELRHTARNRSGFAKGALLAARWINGRKGIYTMEDLMKGLANGEVSQLA